MVNVTAQYYHVLTQMYDSGTRQVKLKVHFKSGTDKSQARKVWQTYPVGDQAKGQIAENRQESGRQG